MNSRYKHMDLPPFVFDYVKMSIQFQDTRASSKKNYVLHEEVESDGRNVIKYDGSVYTFSKAHLIKRSDGFYIDLVYKHIEHRIHVRIKVDVADSMHASDIVSLPNSDIYFVNVDIDNLTKEMSVYRYYTTPKDDIIIDFQYYRVYVVQPFLDKYNKIISATVPKTDNYKNFKYIYSYSQKEGFTSLINSKPLMNQIIDYIMFGMLCILFLYLLIQLWDTITKDD